MKRGTRTWILWYMVVMHILAIIGTTGFVMYMSFCHPSLWNWILLLILSFVNYLFFDSMFKLIERIHRRKNRTL
jgi:hypothetical protein